MMVVEGQRILRNTTPRIIHSQDHWFRRAMFIPRPDRIEVDRGKDVVIQYAWLSGTIRLVIASIPIHVVIVGWSTIVAFCFIFTSFSEARDYSYSFMV
jgi:hypothetical protein